MVQRGSDPSAATEPVRVARQFSQFAAFVAEFSSFISLRGVFLAMPDPLPVGTAVAFDLHLDDGFRLLQGDGEVVWIRPHDVGANEPAGMGIRFHTIDDKGRDLILKILDEGGKKGDQPFELDPPPPGAIAEPAPPAAAEDGPAATGAPAVAATPDAGPADAAEDAFSPPWGELPSIPTDLLEPKPEAPAAGDGAGLEAGAEDADVAAAVDAVDAVEAGEPGALLAADIADLDAAADAAMAVELPASDAVDLDLDPADEISLFDLPSSAEPAASGSDRAAVPVAPLPAVPDEPSFELLPTPTPAPAPTPTPAPEEWPAVDLGAEAVAAPSAESPTVELPLAPEPPSELESPIAPEPPSEPEPPAIDAAPPAARETLPLEGLPALAGDDAPPAEPEPLPADPAPPPAAADTGTPYWLPEPASIADPEPRTGRGGGGRLVALAAIVALLAAGYLYREPLLARLGLGDRSRAAQEGPAAGVPVAVSPATRAPDPDRAEQPSGATPADPAVDQPAADSGPGAAVDDAGAASQDQDLEGAAGDDRPDPAAAVTGSPPSSPPAASTPAPPRAPVAGRAPARRIARVTWTETAGGTRVVIAADGALAPGRVSHLVMDGGAPRLVVRIDGIEAPYVAGRIAVNNAALVRIRTGFHPRASGSQLHLVFDLPSAGIAFDDDRLRFPADGASLELLLPNP